ncbi:Sodium-dependent nutrient amino acid transporter 1 [Zootermopsis nevadensis]|uniref:Sodium-dependent nutrient amino acid transporter 1 n=2 Tax=Zootermopsis nevadensis TaxID=136037 RepID=A0A067QF05_ZOONE|nr:Sodium-dependent nutrient amino acid transporter 1 [Zootermopsis nevadensis]
MWFGVGVAFLFLLWSLFMLCTFKREHSYRVSVYVILAPVIACLVALLVQSILSDTSVYGLQKLMIFQWDYLLDIKVWYFATVQMFFSTHLGFGNIVTCAGRLYSKNNALWTAVFYVVSNLLIGILTVCIVYQWIGQRKTDNLNIDIPEEFIYTLTYDVAVNYMGSLKQLWSALTFFVIICGGFIAMVAVLYTVLVAVTLEINKRWSWWIMAGCICTIGFLIGIICIIPHNMEVVHILDHYVIGRMVIASTALELVAFAWIYGSNTLYNDFEFVLGHKLNPIWKVIWLITPFLLIVVEIWSMVSLPLTGFPGRTSDPVWVYVTGWVLYMLTWVIVISAAIQQISSQVDYNLSQKFLSTLKPSRNWGPVDTIYRHWWVQWRVTCTKTGQRDFTFKRRGTKDYTSSVQKYHTAEPAGIYRITPSSTNGTLQHNRATDRGPFTIHTNGHLPEHVCWRGTLQRGGDGT